MKVSDPQNLKQLGTILGVWAHPDDESFMTAGLMAAAIQNGQTVACITATKGDAGETSDEKKWPKSRLGEIRAKELENAFKILGVKNHHWLNYLDGHCHEIYDEEGAQKVLAFIEKYQPDTIVTFPPDGITGHNDHKAVSRWAREAIIKSGKEIGLYYAVDTKENYDNFFKELDEKFNLYFNIDRPVLVPKAKCDLVFELSEKVRSKKVKAIKSMVSQTAGMFKEFGEQGFLDALKTECFVLADSVNPAKWPL